MCLFLNGAQYFYEVKILPNEKEKYFSDGDNRTNSSLSNFSNEWLIVKNKFRIENNVNPRMTSRNQFNFKNENTTINIEFSNLNNIKTVRDFLCKKFTVNNKELITGSKQTNKSNIIKTITTNKIGNGVTTDKTKISTSNFKDPLNELFEEEDEKKFAKYDFPLSTLIKTNRNPNANPLSQNLNNSKKPGLIPPKGTNKIIKNSSSTTRNNPIDSELLLRENLLKKNPSNSSLNKNNVNSNRGLISNKPQEKTISINDINSSQTLTITNTSKGFSEQQSIQNTQNRQLSSYHRQTQQEQEYYNTIENDNNIYINVSILMI
jgi:hypothetical protein